MWFYTLIERQMGHSIKRSNQKGFMMSVLWPKSSRCSVHRGLPGDLPVGLHGADAVEQRLLQQPKADAGVHGVVEHLQLVDVDIGKPL